MKRVSWPCSAPGGNGEEVGLAAGPADATRRVLIVPALFEETNRTRRLLAQTMRAAAAQGVATVLPELPGCGESLAPLDRQSLASWRQAMAFAAEHFAATHLLAVRGGALVAPADLPGWRLAPTAGALRSLLRARTIAAREAGRSETAAELLVAGQERGLELAGYKLGPTLIADLEQAALPDAPDQIELTVGELGGEALWLRSEPGEDAHLALALAAHLADAVG